MRLPRVRFTVRRLMVYVAVIAVVPYLTISWRTWAGMPPEPPWPKL
jgi:hypothetical protein